MRAVFRRLAVLVAIVSACFGGAVRADDEQAAPQAIYPAAIFTFEERGRDTKELGQQTADLLFANLAAEPSIYLVDRADLKKLLEEQELNLSGLVNPAESTRVGQLTGAKLIITGSVLQVGDNLHLIAKIIGTETSRVVGATAKGPARGDLDELVTKLAGEITKAIVQRSGDLVAKPLTREDHIAAIKKGVGEGKLPSIAVKVTERHIGQASIDPAAETELLILCKEAGFDVVDLKKTPAAKPDILLVGEAFSEFAMRHGNLVSVKARLELKAVDQRSDKVLAADRQVAVEVDLTEQIAGKNALQEAAIEVAKRLLPKVVAAKGK